MVADSGTDSERPHARLKRATDEVNGEEQAHRQMG